MNCSNCGAHKRLGASFCHVCGSPIEQSASKPETKIDTSFGLPGKGVGAIVIMILCVALAKACASGVVDMIGR